MGLPPMQRNFRIRDAFAETNGIRWGRVGSTFGLPTNRKFESKICMLFGNIDAGKWELLQNCLHPSMLSTTRNPSKSKAIELPGALLASASTLISWRCQGEVRFCKTKR